MATEDDVRRLALALPEVAERPSYGTPGFRVKDKLFARIHRFRRALKLIDQGDGPLADIALAAGYYDQPHMNAELRELSGLAPGEFLAAVRYPNSVSVAEPAERT